MIEKRIAEISKILSEILQEGQKSIDAQCEVMRKSRTKHKYTCVICGKQFEAYATVRPNAERTCSNSCRAKKYNQRKKLKEELK